MKERSMCIEACPLSNQFLYYVYNLSQHPAIAFYHMGLPISINPDDPARFGYNGSTPDFFVAAHAFGFDLKDFKLLGIYSILHAVCSEDLKGKLLKQFAEDWAKFMDWFKEKYTT
jgi:adenosine deaminase CECR1